MSSIALNSNCIQYANNSTLCRSCKINKKDTCIKESKKILPQLQNSQLNLISYLTLVKQNLCLSHQINCRHNINLTMNDYRFAAITPNRKRNKMEATWFNYWWKRWTNITAWKLSKYRVLFGSNTEKYEPEIRTRKNSVFRHFSRSIYIKNAKRLIFALKHSKKNSNDTSHSPYANS